MTLRLTFVVSLVLGAVLGCGSTHAHRTTPSAQSEAAPAPSSGAGPLAALRPSGSEPVLAALQSQPTDGSALVRAATYYARTDAAGMTLLWGVMYGALGADDAQHAEVAHAIVSALQAHVSMEREGTTTHVSTALAPGSVPVIADGRTMRAPIAHLFELRTGPALIAWDGGAWTLDATAHVIVGLAHGSGPGNHGLETHAEIFEWLVRAETAGVLDAFAVWLVGPAFPSELETWRTAHAAELDAARAFVAASPFAPSHAVLPDDLVPFP